jgi:hypothetical protein
VQRAASRRTGACQLALSRRGLTCRQDGEAAKPKLQPLPESLGDAAKLREARFTSRYTPTPLLSSFGASYGPDGCVWPQRDSRPSHCDAAASQLQARRGSPLPPSCREHGALHLCREHGALHSC